MNCQFTTAELEMLEEGLEAKADAFNYYTDSDRKAPAMAARIKAFDELGEKVNAYRNEMPKM